MAEQRQKRNPAREALTETRHELFISYLWDDPDEAFVSDVSGSLAEARMNARSHRTQVYIYRLERLPDGAYGNESFIETAPALPGAPPHAG